ncbi:MAG TPA: hypothetical protein VKM54_23260 [Myxococcota bacterium]|nr:hypothetical protein [Myxococcota bacterium]
MSDLTMREMALLNVKALLGREPTQDEVSLLEATRAIPRDARRLPGIELSTTEVLGLIVKVVKAAEHRGARRD